MVKPLFPMNKCGLRPVPVLPTVYSDALSYTEQVGKLCEKLDEVIEYVNDFNKDLQGYVNDWLEAHPEATTTVQDHSLSLEKMIIGTLGFVTPEMYGAVGDGITDDTTAIQSALDSDKIVILKNIYKITAPLNVNNTYIIGKNAKIIGERHTILSINNKTNVLIYNVELKTESYEDGLNANININDSSNVVIEKVKMSKGCYGVNIYNSDNVSVNNCTLEDFFVNDSTGNGGYSILLETCRNIYITKCNFTKNYNGKHCIYVSLRGGVGQNENIYIEQCLFDNTQQLHKAPTTVPVNVRATRRCVINNNTFNKTSGCITLNVENGNFEEVIITNNIFKNYIYATGAAETRSRINIINYGTYNLECFVENNVSFCDDGITRTNYEFFLSAGNSTVHFVNNISKDELFNNVDNCTIFIDGYITNSTNCAFLFKNTVKGGEKNVISDANFKFRFQNATMRIDFFEPKDNRFFLRIREDSFTSGSINKSYQISTNKVDPTLNGVNFPFTLDGNVGAFAYAEIAKTIINFRSGTYNFNFGLIDVNDNNQNGNIYAEFITR